MTEPAQPTDRRKETIIAVTAVLGLLLTYLIYRRSANVAAAGGAAAGPATVNDPNSDGTQQLLTGILNSQQTLSGQLGQIIGNTTSTTSTTPSTPARSTALFHISDFMGGTLDLKHLAQAIYGVATPGNIEALRAANPQFRYAGKVGSGTKIVGVNRGTGVVAPLPPLPLATIQHVPLTPVDLHTHKTPVVST